MFSPVYLYTYVNIYAHFTHDSHNKDIKSHAVTKKYSINSIRDIKQSLKG